MRISKFNYRFVLKTLGFLLIIESLFMMLAALVSFYMQEEAGDYILLSCTVTFIAGVILRLLGTDDYEKSIGKRESFLVVSLIWVVLSFFGMLPYYLSGAIPNITQAYFETISGFTTTGATILTDIEAMPKGLLFWRSITQWIGAVGIIVFALAVLPMVGGNASILYDAEMTGIVRDRFRPKVSQIAKRICASYIFLTTLCIFLLWLGPMTLHDAVCHGFSTMATGGFSTKQASIAHWDSAYLEAVMAFFMFVGGINFVLIYFFLRGIPKKLFKDDEFRAYFSITLSLVFILAIGLYIANTYDSILHTIRVAGFHAVSFITTTGFTTENYMEWGAFYRVLLCLVMISCASAGSTSGGLKVIRIVVLVKNAINEFRRQVEPNAVIPVRVNGQVVPVHVVTKVLAFIFLYVAIVAFSALVLAISGMGFEESIGAAISCMGNVGMGLGENGYTGNFADIPTFSKWYLGFIMLVGRLEIFTVLSLFMPAFWKR